MALDEHWSWFSSWNFKIGSKTDKIYVHGLDGISRLVLLYNLGMSETCFKNPWLLSMTRSVMTLDKSDNFPFKLVWLSFRLSVNNCLAESVRGIEVQTEIKKKLWNQNFYTVFSFTMLQKLSKCEVRAWLCRNMIILPSLRFHVKSNFGEFKWSKNVNFDYFRGFSNFEQLSSPKFTKNLKFRVSETAKNDISGPFEFTKIWFHVKSE